MTGVIIPTDDMGPRNEKWQPMCEWLTANHFDIHFVPIDAEIEIRDGTCLGVEMFIRKEGGGIVWTEGSRPPTQVEWHPLIQQPPAILLPRGAS